MIINIGYLQFLPEFLKVRKNLDEVERLVKKNKESLKKVDLVVFPEYFLSGPLKLDLIKDYEQEISSKQILGSLKNISKTSPKTTFVMGSFLLKQKGDLIWLGLYLELCNIFSLMKTNILLEEHFQQFPKMKEQLLNPPS